MNEVGSLVGQRLEEVRVGMASITLVFDVGDRVEPALYASVEQGFVVVGSDGVARDTAVDWDGAVGCLAGAVGNAVVRAEATPEGAFSVAFADGSSFRCDPHADCEAWQVVGGSPQSLVVCLPGGDLSVWDSSRVPTSAEAEEAIGLVNELMGWNAELGEVTEDGRILVNPGVEAAEPTAEREDA